MRHLLLAVFVCWFMSASWMSARTIPVTVREYHGIARNNEPTATGVPLPQGLYTDERVFSIQGVPATQVKPLVRWPDGSIRWLLVQFPATVGANGSAVYTLSDSGGGATSGSMVSEDASRITVDTGPLVFSIRKTGGWNLFDEVRLNGTTIVAPVTGDGARITATHNNMLFKSDGEDHEAPLLPYAAYVSTTKTYRVSVLENGPVRSVIRVEGNFGNHAGDPGYTGTPDHEFYSYTAYIHAYKDQSYIKVQFVLRNAPYWIPRGALKFEALDLRTHALLTNGPLTATGYTDSLQTQALGAEAYIYQSTGNAFSSSFNSGSRALGWLDVSDASRGVAVGIKSFWGQHPGRVSIQADGTVTLSPLPMESPDTFWLVDRTQKEWTMMYYFHEGGAAAAQSARVMGGALNHPLFPTCDRAWYADTRAMFGDFSPPNTPVVHPSQTLIPAELASTPINYHYTGWYMWGGNIMMNSDWTDREMYHWDAISFLNNLDPKEYDLFEGNVKIDHLMPYHNHSDYRTMQLFRSRGQALVNPNNWTHKDYYDNIDGNRREHATLADPIHWGPGTLYEQVPGHTSYPQGEADIYRKWEFLTKDHFEARHIYDWYCLTGDPSAHDVLRDAGESGGGRGLMMLAVIPPNATDYDMQRHIICSVSNWIFYYLAHPNTYTKNGIDFTIDQYVRYQGDDNGCFGLNGNFSFSEALAAHLMGALYEATGRQEALDALEKSTEQWYRQMMPTGYIPYLGGNDYNVAPLPANQTSWSYQRALDGIATIRQYLPWHEELWRRIQQTNDALKYTHDTNGLTMVWWQKYKFLLSHPTEFTENPLPSVTGLPPPALPPAPGAPGSVSVETKSPSSTIVSWSAAGAAHAEAFQIQRQGGFESDWTIIGAVKNPKVSWNDGTRSASGTYQYRVRAVNRRGASPWVGIDTVLPPTITLQPAAATASPGDTTTFTAAATGTGTLRYQWQFNNQDIEGATGPSCSVPTVGTGSQGWYRVIVTDDAGTVKSEQAYLTVSGAHNEIINISTRAQCQTGDDVLIPGFIVLGPGTKKVVIRAVGPKLLDQGAGLTADQVLSNPSLRLFRKNYLTERDDLLAEQTDWVTAPDAAAVEASWGPDAANAFTLRATEATPTAPAKPTEDLVSASLVVDLPEGVYSATCQGESGGTGIALVEVLDADKANTATKIYNISTRAVVGTGDSVVLPGFILNGNCKKMVLIRALGPSVGPEVTGALADPKIRVFKSNGSTGVRELILENDDWGSSPQKDDIIAATSKALGVTPLDQTSKDAVALISADPITEEAGFAIYQVEVSGVGGSTGVALVEVFEINQL